jgi:hypothetical protein
VDDDNLERLTSALADLQASPIAVPPFERRYLERGLAVHFRCRHPDANGLRVDIMSKMRSVDEFPSLWNRRTSLEFGEETLDVMSLPDLVQSKKTQCDKDWPMLARLVEANYFANRSSPSQEQIQFWLIELRSPQLLVEVAMAHATAASHLHKDRPLLRAADRVVAQEGGIEPDHHRHVPVQGAPAIHQPSLDIDQRGNIGKHWAC